MMHERQSRWFLSITQKHIPGICSRPGPARGIPSSLFSSPCVPKQPKAHPYKFSQPGIPPEPEEGITVRHSSRVGGKNDPDEQPAPQGFFLNPGLRIIALIFILNLSERLP